MKTCQKDVLDRFTRIRRYMNQHARALAPVNQSHARVSLDELLASVAQHHAVQRATKASRRTIAARLRSSREALRLVHLRPIVAIARARTEHVPMLGALRMPRPGLSDSNIVTEARVLATHLAEHRGVFLDEGLEDDFIERLLAAANAVATAAHDADQCRMAGVVATANIADLITRGHGLTRVLDALVRSKIGGDERLAAEWRAVNSLKRPAPVKGVSRAA